MSLLGPAWRVFEVSFCKGLVVARALSRRSRWARLFSHLGAFLRRYGHVAPQVIKSIQSITREVIRDFMINKVLPAIRAKCPREDVNKPIFIQQDNAPSHLKVDDPQFCEIAKQDRFDIRLICQPSNSPDFNILDLGFSELFKLFNTRKMLRQ